MNTRDRRLDLRVLGVLAAAILLWGRASAAAGGAPEAAPEAKGGGQEQAEPFHRGAPSQGPGAEDKADPGLIDPGPEGCPFNERPLELLV